jgi:ribonuclease VapC
MVVDTSAWVAIVRGEPESEDFARAMACAAENPHISAVSLLEVGLVLSPAEYEDFLEDLRDTSAVIQAFDAATASLAIEAGRRYGKRTKSKAQLNFGDCCSYATAKVLRMPLLFKGNDFVHTDIERAR